MTVYNVILKKKIATKFSAYSKFLFEILDHNLKLIVTCLYYFRETFDHFSCFTS